MALPRHYPQRDGVVFVDRGSEAEALVASLESHRRRLVRDDIGLDEYRNVLVFYGAGGTGKTKLSERLERWLGGDATCDEHWGPAPSTAVAATGRWELNDSQGGLDAYDLLLTIRRTFGRVQQQWPAFDLAFVALAQGLRRDDNVELTSATAGHRAWSITDVVAGALNDIGTLAGFGVTNLAGVGVGLIANVLSQRHQSRRTRKLLEDYPGLDELVEDCQTTNGSEAEVRDLAGRVAYLLTLDIDTESPTQRPLITVFVDHIERVQSGATSGEALLHTLVLRLPHVLFTMTGRNALRWAEPNQTHLERPGPRTWPGLILADPPPSEPRQHLLGNLSEPDAITLLQHRLAQVRARVADDVIETLARTTDGWPLHLDAIISVAAERADEDPLTLDDLGGSLPKVVDRLSQDLPDDERAVFHAACLLPYFDVELASHAAQQTAGAAERFTRRSIVLDNPSSRYPYRIHDEIRRLVRTAGAEASAGWNEHDWTRHAQLALNEAHRRFESAMEHHDDRAAIHALALAINIGAENALFDDWFATALRRSPSIISLSTLIPATVTTTHHPDMHDILNYLRAMALDASNDKADALASIERRGRAIASTAGLWHAYTLRSLGRLDEAAEQFRHLVSTYDDWPAIYSYQLRVTHRMARRFAWVIEHLDELSDEQRRMMTASLAWRHGKPADVIDMLISRADRASSRRFQIELHGSTLLANHELGLATAEDADRVLQIAQRVGNRNTIGLALAVKGQMHHFDDETSTACLKDAAVYTEVRGSADRNVTTLLALRGWVTGDSTLLLRAQQHAAAVPGQRSSSWIGPECLLEHLGYPVPDTPPTEWLEPYEVVAQRWIDIYTGIVERARP